MNRAIMIASALATLQMSAAVAEAGAGNGQTSAENPVSETGATAATASNKIVLTQDATVEVAKKFGFRKTKDEKTGKEIPAAPPVEVKLKLLTLQGVIELLQSGNAKVIELLVDCANTPMINQARDMIDELGVDTVRAAGIPEEKYSFQHIAELPPASKAAFDEDTWNAFKADYVNVICANGGVTQDQAKMGADILATRLNRVKSNKEALQQFRTRIQTWYGNTGQKEEMFKVYQYLLGRCEEFIAANEPETILASF